ncbi:hypothetical protein B566_EDAN014377 [Ephemera danica]|nr:hypothetical protein B566_EDAN014377 [Ephemera danica]
MRLATSHLAATSCCLVLIAVCDGFDADSGSRGPDSQYYPFVPGAGVGVGGVGIQAGVGGVGYPGYFPAGYPYPIVAGPFGQQTQQQTTNRRRQPKPRPTQITVEDVSESETSTARPTKVDEGTESPGLVQSIREFTSPLFHAGQRIESRANSRYRSSPSLG